MELYADIDVVAGDVSHGFVGVGLGSALAVDTEPGEAAADVGEVAVVLVGVEGDQFLEVLDGWLVGGGGIVAEGGGVVEGGPGGSVDARLVDDGRGGVGDRVALVAAVANDVEDEEAEDDGEEDVVAGT